MKLKMRRMGGSLGATFPKELTDQMQLNDGDELFVVKTERGYLLTEYDPNFEKAMEAYEVLNRKYRNALRELAK
jgi:putative addiction module antidote